MDQHLHVFVAVAEKKNFSRAAEELHMTQPSVSQYIRTLEEKFGTKLLERTNKYVRLNKAGEVVYHHAKEILGLYTKTQTLVDDLLNQAKGPLSIGASYTFGEYVLPRMLALLKKTYPELQPALTIGNTTKIASLVTSHQLDIGIVEGNFKDKQLIIEDYAEDYMVVVASPEHAFAKRDGYVEKNELEAETWIVREEGSGTREATEMMFEEMAISPERKINFGSTQSIKEVVEAGLGITLLSQWAVQKELKNGDLKIINVEGLPFSRQFSIITQTPFQTKSLEVFKDLLYKERPSVDALGGE
ncbi:DNA-binding transcriptional regulator, LysR family [Lentibacillus persicus]|uniref:DNA-binding transcriptional regulator, LysR family n=1 Tax=Lentibacillus persicus TaxID=640948 RepID=A0A1I2A3M3_9BACI|nr:LysR family transcriptional regulator [Lentibacillus persicus]SFE38379.1 DNA-binding transcriptional regulator, LysR family [Lentibacillus persicus]